MNIKHLTSIHSFPVLESEWTYNIKWTILSMIAYMITKEKPLSDLFDKVLHDSVDAVQFADYLPEILTDKPVFACDFLGHRSFAPNTVDRLYVVQYRGVMGTFSPSSEPGEENLSRAIEFLHDSLITNFVHLSAHHRLKIFDFRQKGVTPRDTTSLMAMHIEESTFEYDPSTGARLNGLNLMYRVETL